MAIDYNKNLERRQHLFDLYQDPNWLLQAGLGDIEFEQDMYDDFMYGKPAQLNPKDRQFLDEQLDFFGFPDDSYDKLAMEGLRKHSGIGPYKYLDHTPYDIGPYEIEGPMTVSEGTDPDDYFAMYNELERKPGVDPTTKIPANWMDFNMPKIINHWNKYTYDNKQGNLQNQISDYARHEYKHALYPDKPGDYSHPAIFGSGVRYNLDPVTTGSSWKKFRSPEEIPTITQYNPHMGGEMAQEMTQKYARPPKGAVGFNRGGIVSLVI